MVEREIKKGEEEEERGTHNTYIILREKRKRQEHLRISGIKGGIMPI